MRLGCFRVAMRGACGLRPPASFVFGFTQRAQRDEGREGVALGSLRSLRLCGLCVNPVLARRGVSRFRAIGPKFIPSLTRGSTRTGGGCWICGRGLARLGIRGRIRPALRACPSEGRRSGFAGSRCERPGEVQRNRRPGSALIGRAGKRAGSQDGAFRDWLLGQACPVGGALFVVGIDKRSLGSAWRP